MRVRIRTSGSRGAATSPTGGASKTLERVAIVGNRRDQPEDVEGRLRPRVSRTCRSALQSALAVLAHDRVAATRTAPLCVRKKLTSARGTSMLKKKYHGRK